MKVEFVRGTLQTKLKSPRNSDGMNSRNPKLRLIWAGVYEIKKPRSMSALGIFKIRKKWFCCRLNLIAVFFDTNSMPRSDGRDLGFDSGCTNPEFLNRNFTSVRIAARVCGQSFAINEVVVVKRVHRIVFSVKFFRWNYRPRPIGRAAESPSRI